MDTIDTDYLIVGAGAAGMAFADTLIDESDADVVMVDRRHAPGGHWHDAYPFVRLHQPSATYGVNSRSLGANAIDAIGSDAGYYERATAPEICGYYQKVLDEVLLPSGQVRFFGMCDYVGDRAGEHRFTSRLTGAVTQVRVRRRIVDTTFLELSVPATHTPSFAVDPQVRFMPVGGVVELDDAPSGYTVLGGGKTAMDACYWLLERGVDPDRIRWVRPREAWVIPRRYFQPLDLVAPTLEGFVLALETLVQARTPAALYLALEECGLLRRFDRNVEPTMFRGAILSDAECDALESIEQVIRLGHIRRVGVDRVEFEHGEIPGDPREVYLDCTANAFQVKPVRPIFEPDRITPQGLVGGFTSFSSATTAFVEARRSDDAVKNRLCVPTPPLNLPRDWIHAYRGMIHTTVMNAADADMAAWLDATRLNITAGLSERKDDPRVEKALARTAELAEPAMRNADRLLTA
ncbi:MAG: NAD(P)-binding protein [Gammaproteobacteria bacterium]